MSGNQDISAAKSSSGWIQRTLLYRRWEAIRKEIMLHKWYESEKAGHDIGWERAAIDWLIKYGSAQAEKSSSDSADS